MTVPSDVARGEAVVTDDQFNLFIIQLSSIRMFESGVRYPASYFRRCVSLV